MDLAGVAGGTRSGDCKYLCCPLSRAEQPACSWQGSGLLQQPPCAWCRRTPGGVLGGQPPHSQLRGVAAAKGVCGGLGMGLEWPRVSLLEHPWPCRVQQSVQPKAEQDSVTAGGHQPALPGCSCRAPAFSQLEELPELSPFPGPHLQREMETLSWQLCMLDLLTEAEPPGRPTCLQRLQDQRCFPSVPGEELLAWPAEQSSTLIRHGCCRSSSQALGAGELRGGAAGWKPAAGLLQKVSNIHEPPKSII